MISNGIHRRFIVLTILSVLVCAYCANSAEPTPAELNRAREWVGSNLLRQGPSQRVPPFSFQYSGKSSESFLGQWRFKLGATIRGDRNWTRTDVYTDPATGLEVRCELQFFEDFPGVEWVLYFKNPGREPTPIIESIRALDTRLLSGHGSTMLRYALGSDAKPTDFSPQEKVIGPETNVVLAPIGGRSSDSTAVPFFNLVSNAGDGCEGCLEGVMAGLGWSGQWEASFRGVQRGVDVTMGMQRTHLKLLPGETIRTPRILLLFWQGTDEMRGNNLLRSFLLAYHTPHPGGKMPEVPVAHNTWFQFDEGNSVTESNLIDFAKRLHERKLAIDAMVIDAGWFEGGWPSGAGSWFPKKDSFPNGLRPVGDAVHQLGMRFCVWYEPERVSSGSWLDTHHPEWLLREGKKDELMSKSDEQKLFNLGNPEARQWLTDYISTQIDQFGIDIYRHDFNIEPLGFWQKADAPDRIGMSEIRYVEGFYQYWDELQRRHPNLLIDNCASGGRRIDLETTSRAIPLWRSDHAGTPIGVQALGLGLNLVIPLSSSGFFTSKEMPPNLYEGRNIMSAGMVCTWDPRRPEFDEALARQIVKEQKLVAPLFRGDIYPLTKVTTSEKDWMAYQCHRADLGQGMIMAFRRQESAEDTLVVKARGLKLNATYELEDLDAATKRVVSGKELSAGVSIHLPSPRSSNLLIYRAKP